jgi:hypothetical protein
MYISEQDNIYHLNYQKRATNSANTKDKKS